MMRYLMLSLLFFCSLSTHAVTLSADAPIEYVVQPGDTLWDIAKRYLVHPWEWKELWQTNSKIKNPNKIYPGAILQLNRAYKAPYIKVLSNGTVKLSPYMRPLPPESPITAIALSDIEPFLDASLILDKDTLTNAPYVVALTKEHLLGGQGDEVYVKDLCPPKPPAGTPFSYGIYRPCGIYKDLITEEFLGYKAILIGYGQLVRGGNPATIFINRIKQGVEIMDKVMPNDHPGFDFSFLPKAPAFPVKGHIVSIASDYEEGAVGLVVVVNLGNNVGVEAGDVLGIYSRPINVPAQKCTPDCVVLPPERIGEAMIFRTFSKASFALVVRSTQSIKPQDIVTNP